MFFTPDLLLALLDIPNSRTVECFDEVQAGLGRRVREWLSRNVSALNASPVRPFEPFEWTERQDIQLAQDLALIDGAAAVSEVYLLLGVLGSESGTRQQLAALLGPDYDRLYEVASQRRRCPAQVLKTPGLDHGLNDADWQAPRRPTASETETP